MVKGNIKGEKKGFHSFTTYSSFEKLFESLSLVARVFRNPYNLIGFEDERFLPS